MNHFCLPAIRLAVLEAVSERIYLRTLPEQCRTLWRGGIIISIKRSSFAAFPPPQEALLPFSPPYNVARLVGKVVSPSVAAGGCCSGLVGSALQREQLLLVVAIYWWGDNQGGQLESERREGHWVF